MATKKPSAAQLAARKKFAEMAKNGTLAKKRAAASKKPKSKTALKKPSAGLTTLCAKTVGVPGRRKKDGTQKKGYVSTKGGTLKKKPVAKKATAKKATGKKKPSTKKKSKGLFAALFG